MNVLHIAAHMGDGAGKAIGGLALIGQQRGDQHRILLLEPPRKQNHIDQCRAAGIEFLPLSEAAAGIANTDIVIINWWGSKVMDDFLRTFPPIPCRVLLWTHKNGFYDPPLPEEFVCMCDHLLVTSPLSFQKPVWRNGTLVYGSGTFSAKAVAPKRDYFLHSGTFRIGYVGMPSYKRFPKDICIYLKAVLNEIPTAQFVFAGEYSDEFRADLEIAGLLNRVTLLGWTEQVADLLPTFDVFGYLLRPDTSATTENSVLEAMAAALPVVMSRKPVGTYLVGDTAGILVDSPEEYAYAMKRLYEEQSLRKKLGQAARKKAVIECNGYENYTRFQKACGQTMQRDKKVHCFCEK